MKINHNIHVFFLLFVTALFAACDEDVDKAYDLNGIWEGTINGNYYNDHYPNESSESWDTEICFVQDGDFSNGGYGVERDYALNSNYYTQNKFDWEVRNGRIYLSYDDGYDVIIDDYDIYSRGNSLRFRGYFNNSKGTRLASFDLIKTEEWSDKYSNYAKKRSKVIRKTKNSNEKD